ncbi:MAG TPA: class F sortase [Pseudonocardiaceae bacterium]|nr:class F sortase [Pseudonocardiaceae bacterium]
MVTPSTTRFSVLCAVVLAVAVFTGGCQANQAAAGPGQQTTIAGPILPVQSAPPASISATPPARVPPVSVRIPSIDATSTLVPLGLNPDGSVQVPPVSTPMQAGWYSGGSAPGELGPAVLLGHVDGDKQIGIFFRLHELKAGDPVLVTRADGSVERFTVTKVTKVAKDAFPTAAVYGPTKDAELRLVTCGGTFDHAAHSYVDNVIVYAALA